MNTQDTAPIYQPVALVTPASQLPAIDPKIIESIILKGDISGLNPEQRIQYYNYRCKQAGLDQHAKPFDLLRLNGKEVLYANASCTQQLCAIHKLSTQITARELVGGIYTVCARVSGPDGRATENMGAVPTENLKGEALSNAFLKATTKAVRRTVLAHCGLGMMDESETTTIPEAQHVGWQTAVVVESPKSEGDGREEADKAIEKRLVAIQETESFEDALKAHQASDDWMRRTDDYLKGIDALMLLNYPEQWAQYKESRKPKKEPKNA